MMWKLPCSTAIIVGLMLSTAGRSEDLNLTAISFNVLAEFIPSDVVPTWNDRKGLVVELLKNHDPDLVGLQEATPRQVAFLVDSLGSFAAFHFPRYNYTDATLLFRSDRFELVDSGHWWLSPKADQPLSTGFGNTLPRLVVWVKLKHKVSGQLLYAINTHFDNTMPSQVKMAALCQEKLGLMAAENLPMIWMGDFNTDQKRGDYSTLTSNGWKDSYRASKLASQDGRDDNVPTFENGSRIDHIFYHGPLEATAWERLESSKPLSDHYPILARFVVRR